MYQNVQAQTEPEYDFSRYVGSITPELEPEGYGLIPFHSGRPMYGKYGATMDVGILSFIWRATKWIAIRLSWVVIAFTVLWAIAEGIWNAINWMIEMKYRKYFKEWMLDMLGQMGVVGGTRCSYAEGRGQEYADCIVDEHKKLFRAFADKARKCEGGRWEGRRTGRSILNVRFEFEHLGSTLWACVEYHKKKRIGTLTPYWDASPWF